jgi:hypothetical protein
MEICVPFVRKRHFSGICACALDQGIIVSHVIEGSFDRDTFIDFLCRDLVSSFASGRPFSYLTASGNEPVSCTAECFAAGQCTHTPLAGDL